MRMLYSLKVVYEGMLRMFLLVENGLRQVLLLGKDQAYKIGFLYFQMYDNHVLSILERMVFIKASCSFLLQFLKIILKSFPLSMNVVVIV